METKVSEPVKNVPTADQLVAGLMPGRETVHLVKLGFDVVIKGLSAKEHSAIKSAATNTLTGVIDNALFLAMTVQKGVVEPKLEPATIAALQETTTGELVKLSDKIWKLSGVGDDVKNA